MQTKRLHFGGCILIALIVMIILVVIMIYGYLALAGSLMFSGGDWNVEQEPWVEVGFVLPNENGRVIFMIQTAHPVLAEYNRKIRIETIGKEPVTLSLPMNTGGDNIVNVYHFMGSSSSGEKMILLRLEDSLGEHIIDLEHGTFLEDENTFFEGWVYVGRFDDRSTELRFYSPGEAPEEKMDKLDND
jgi:hypothetical protein